MQPPDQVQRLQYKRLVQEAVVLLALGSLFICVACHSSLSRKVSSHSCPAFCMISEKCLEKKKEAPGCSEAFRIQNLNHS
jgi:hypothetical protein